eukprot:SAG11_NODE_4550_length_1854_cov_2.067806_3_plen_215_part_00
MKKSDVSLSYSQSGAPLSCRATRGAGVSVMTVKRFTGLFCPEFWDESGIISDTAAPASPGAGSSGAPNAISSSPSSSTSSPAVTAVIHSRRPTQKDRRNSTPVLLSHRRRSPLALAEIAAAAAASASAALATAAAAAPEAAPAVRKRLRKKTEREKPRFRTFVFFPPFDFFEDPAAPLGSGFSLLWRLSSRAAPAFGLEFCQVYGRHIKSHRFW